MLQSAEERQLAAKAQRQRGDQAVRLVRQGAVELGRRAAESLSGEGEVLRDREFCVQAQTLRNVPETATALPGRGRPVEEGFTWTCMRAMR